jgi:hypothetical protein
VTGIYENRIIFLHLQLVCFFPIFIKKQDK